MSTRKKIILATAALLLIITAFLGVRFFTGNTRFSGKSKILYIPTGQNNRDYVMRVLKDSGWLKNAGAFDWLAKQRGCWKKLKSGRYEIKAGTSAWQLVQKLRNGLQDPVNLTITKLRTKEDLAMKISKVFECSYEEAAAFLNNPDSLKIYGLDSNTVMCGVIPNTYTLLWTSPASKVLKRLFAEAEKFWTDERKQKAKAKGYSTNDIYTLASIVEEETLEKADKGKVASVYFNRIKLRMPLQADPTIKFAIRDFGLSRILNVHKEAAYNTPYDTYKKLGLPPGPICTPSANTIDATLDAPDTKYIFFIAQPRLTGFSDFSETLQQHEAYRVLYNRWQDSSKAARMLKAKDTAQQNRP
jgi:UPF0755 protein